MAGGGDGLALYRVMLKSGVEYDRLSVVGVLGNVFELIFHRRGRNEVDFYVRTAAREEILRKYFVVEASGEPPRPRRAGVLRLARDTDFYAPIRYSNLLNLVAFLEPGEQLRIWVTPDSRLAPLLARGVERLRGLARKALVGGRRLELDAQALESSVKSGVYLLEIIFLTDRPARFREFLGQAGRVVVPRSGRLRIEPVGLSSDGPPRIGWWEALAKAKERLWIDGDSLAASLRLPNPAQIPVPMALGVALPYSRLDRSDIYIGNDVLYRERVHLDWTDFQRHAIIYGSTGSGKSNTLEVLATELARFGMVVFLDPNSQSARRLSSVANYYFTITRDRPNFGLNILELPWIYGDRERNIDYQISKILQLFEKILNLSETAVNVRYILQVLLRQMYRVADRFTFKDVYDAVIALYQGTLDLDVNDETFERERELLQRMQAQSFMSILSRLKLLVDNTVFRVVSSETTIDWDELVPGLGRGLIVFDVGKSVGSDVSEMMQMMITLSLYNYVFLRDLRGEEKIPVFLIIDEAQNIAHFDFVNEILAEARKYGLHLIMATQSFVRLKALAGEGNARAINANTNIKIIMRLTEGKDIRELAKSVGADREIMEAMPKLGVGQAFLFIQGRSGEYTVPRLVQVRLSGLPDVEAEPTKGFEPSGVASYITREAINPALALIREPPDPLAQRILYTAFERGDAGINITELVTILGVRRERVLAKLAELEKIGAVQVARSGRSRVVRYAKGLFNVKGVVSNPEGRRVAVKVLRRYMRRGLIVVQGRQGGEVRPDFVVMEYDPVTYRPRYSSVIVVEVESPNEVRTSPEQVRRNMVKYLSLDERVRSVVREVHVWTSEDAYDRLREIYESVLSDPAIPQDYKAKLKIFSVKLRPKRRREDAVAAEPAPGDGAAAQEAPGGAGAVSGAGGVPGALRVVRLGDLVVEVVGVDDGGRALVRIGGRLYRMGARDLADIEALQGVVVGASVSGGRLVYRTADSRAAVPLEPVE